MKSFKISLLFLIFATKLLADSTFVSGTIVNENWSLSGSPYCVTDDIFVAGLVIEPSVDIIFLGNYIFQVNGVLQAIGTEQDSIKFTKPDSVSGWQGIYFENTQPGSELRYCLIEYSLNSGLRIINSTPIIENCTIINNDAHNGGGLNILLDSAEFKTFVLKGCVIENNTSTRGGNSCAGGSIGHGGGGGVFAQLNTGMLVLDNCTINDNSSGVDGRRGNRSGSGIYVNGEAIIKNCIIKGNYCTAYCCPCAPGACSSASLGAGIYANGKITIANCRIEENRAVARACFTGSGFASGGGVYFASGELIMTNTIVSYNSSSGQAGGGSAARQSVVYINSGKADIINCTIAYNGNTGFRMQDADTRIMNSIIYFNDSGQISGDTTEILVQYSNVENGYPGTGNKDINPVFGNPTSLRIVQGSLCIDAGHPHTLANDMCFPPSLGLSRNDIGVDGGPGACGWLGQSYEPIDLDSLVTSVENSNSFAPDKFSLEQNYPNPFNPATTITYELPTTSSVLLVIYNTLGQKIRTLVNEKKESGSYQVTWDGKDDAGRQIATGVYLYRIETERFVNSRKLILTR